LSISRIVAYLDEAIASIWRNRTRSLLTMLGMIIGSASIITVFGISHAATSGISSTFSNFGTFPTVVIADPAQDYLSEAQIQYGDIASISAALSDFRVWVVPEWSPTMLTTFGNVREYPTVATQGGFTADGVKMAYGRKIGQQDVDAATHVCVITADLSKEYFGSADPVGEDLRVNGGRYRVVGVYANLKGSFLNSIFATDTVVVPYTTFHYDLDPDPPESLALYVPDASQAAAVDAIVVKTLQHIHGPRSKYLTEDTSDFLKSFENVLSIVGVGLSAIGGVALVVAGIGIMNIMLVSVTERTREIGIRKAVGASRRDITLQFIMESVVLALAGGGIGMVIGLLVTIGGVSLLSRQLGTMIVPYVLVVSLALGFSIIVGVLFGTYPALRAARLDPIEALRS
jgi:putative ABC transport system permease protein